MALRFRPVDNAFYDLFTKSADAPRRRRRAPGRDARRRQRPRRRSPQRMRDAEHQADETTHEIVRRVNTTFVTPFDREDIYALASGLDDVMDYMEEAVDLILLYEVEHAARASWPSRSRCSSAAPSSPPRRCRGCSTMKDLEEYWIEINRLENAGDKSYRRILAKLFSGQYDALRCSSSRTRRLARGRDRRLREGRQHRRADRRQGVLSGGARDRHRGRRRCPGLRLHQRLPRRRERDRDLGLDPGADPADRPVMAAVMNFVGAFLGPEGRQHRQRRDRSPPAGSHGLVIVMAGLVGAITWNLITWYFGLPSSSSHALIGGLVGAALAAGERRALGRRSSRRSSSRWSLSPLVGFAARASR